MRSLILQAILQGTPPAVKDYVRYIGARQYLCAMLQQHSRDDYRVRQLVRATAVAQRKHHQQLTTNLPTTNQQLPWPS